MPQARNTRLSRLAAGRAQAGSAAAAHRHALQARVAVCAMLRRALIEAGIDPAAIPALRLGGVALAELATIGEPPELPQADLAFDAGEAGILEERFAAKILMLARPGAIGAPQIRPRLSRMTPPQPRRWRNCSSGTCCGRRRCRLALQRLA